MKHKIREIVGHPRLVTTLRSLRRLITTESAVVEIGANDASFRTEFCCSKWTTVDKFGDPDLTVELNSASLELPFPSKSVDVLICTEVLEHLTLGGPLVMEIARVLKGTGTAVISVPNITSLKSRVKVLFGYLPNMAASGDCGHPLDGTGVFLDGHWIAAHVVDFNEARLTAYLERGGLSISKYHKISIEVRLRCLARLGSFIIPSCLYPRTFSDFILVEAIPKPR